MEIYASQSLGSGWDLTLKNLICVRHMAREYIRTSCFDMFSIKTLLYAVRYMHSLLEMTFTNNPYGGAYVLKKDKWSDFQSCYTADTNNLYSINDFKCEISRTREEIFKRDNFPEDAYIVFRTRTAVDRAGNLVSAHYGKIYGDWSYPRMIKFGGTLFNSKPNDPNLEDEESGIRARLNINGMRERGEIK